MERHKRVGEYEGDVCRSCSASWNDWQVKDGSKNNANSYYTVIKSTEKTALTWEFELWCTVSVLEQRYQHYLMSITFVRRIILLVIPSFVIALLYQFLSSKTTNETKINQVYRYSFEDTISGCKLGSDYDCQYAHSLIL